MDLESGGAGAGAILLGSVAPEGNAEEFATLFTQLPNEVVAAPVGQSDVAHQQIEFLLGGGGTQSRGNSVGNRHVVANGLEKQLHRANTVDMVVDQENSGMSRHVRSHIGSGGCK